MRIGIQIKLIMMVVSIISGVTLFSTFFVSRSVEARLTKIFQDRLEATLDSVKGEYKRIEEETLASAKSFAEMTAVVRNVLLKERLEVQKEIIKLRGGVDLDIIEVCDEQGVVLVGGFDPEVYGEDKSSDLIIIGALAGETTKILEITPSGFLIRASAPIMLGEKVIGVLSTGYFLNGSFLERIKRMTGVELFLFKVELFLFKKGQGKEKIVAATLPIDKAKIESIFDSMATAEKGKQDRINIGGRNYIVGSFPLLTPAGEIIGMMKGVLPSGQLIAAIAGIKQFLAMIALVGICIAALVGYLYARRITTPIRLLVKGTEAVARGNFEHKISVKTKDELGGLATAFNAMTENLSATTVSRDKLIHEAAERSKVQAELLVAYDTLKKTQEQLIQAEKMRTIGILASGVAHEVKNPLATISMCIDYFSGQVKATDKDSLTMYENMKDAVKRAKSIIEGLLDFSSPSTMKMTLQSLNSTIDKALVLVTSQLEEGRIKIIKDFKKDIPDIVAEETKILQVFVNLFDNAFHAMPDGGELTVRTYAKKLTETGQGIGFRKEDIFRLGDTVVVAEIEDTGEGIPQKTLSSIVDPFFTTRRQDGGTGLGLSIVQGIVTMHQGKISFENKKESKGLKVTLMLRIKKEA